MVRNPRKLMVFEKDQLRRRMPLKQKLKILEELYKEAVALKAIPPKNPLEGFETDIKLAKALNRVTSKPA